MFRTSVTVVELTVTLESPLVVNGTLVLLPGSIAVIHIANSSSPAPISVTGTILLDGSMTLFIDDVADNTLIQIIDGAGEINGTFTEITVMGLQQDCKILRGDSTPLSGGFGVLVRVDDSGCKSRGLSKGAIAGIVIGGVAVIALLVIGGLLIFRRFRPGASVFQFHTKREEGWR